MRGAGARFGGMRLALAFALACGYVAAEPSSSQPTFLTLETINAPEQLPAETWLSDRADWSGIYNAWRATFNVESASEIEAALNLLPNGHPGFRIYALEKLRAPDSPLSSLSPEVQTDLSNAETISHLRLRDRTVEPFIDEVRQSLKQHSASLVPLMLSQLDGFDVMPAPAVLPILDLLESELVKEESGRQSFEDAILSIGELGQAKPRLQVWRSDTNPKAAERRLFAQAALARSGQSLSNDEYLALINTGRVTLVRPALRAMRTRQLTSPLLTAVAKNFFAQLDLETWQEGYALLSEQAPGIISDAYEELTPNGAATWPPEVFAAFITAAPVSADARIASLDYELPQSEPCGNISLAAAILERRARREMEIGDAVVAYGKPRLPDCRKQLIASFRQSPRLIAVMGASAEQAMLEGRIAAAADLANLGARLRASAAPESFWERFRLPEFPGEAELRIVQAMTDVPNSILKAIASKVMADPEADRADRALLTLAAHNGAALFPDAFSHGLSAFRSTTARTAAALLTAAYASQPEVPSPGEQMFEQTMKRSDLEPALKSALAAALASRGAPFDLSWVQQTTPSTGEKCAPLMAAPPITDKVAVQLLSDAMASPGVVGDELRTCVLTLAAPEASVRELAAFSAAKVLQNPIDTISSWWRIRRLQSSTAFEAANQQLREAAAARRRELTLSLAATLSAGAPTALLTHFGLWALLLAVYPRSPSLQSFVFWNPLARRILGLGYIDLVLIYVPWARRKLLQPFRGQLLGDILRPAANQLDRIDYYPDSRVVPLNVSNASPHPRVLIDALRSHKGRLLLIGQSGLGKSSFLRYWLSHRAAAGREEIAYLRADECRGGVEAEIERRMQQLGNDRRLVHALIYAGKLFVYIDGYNEVEVSTQDAITRFLGDHPFGNILVCTQIPLRGFTGAPGWRLLPLERDQAYDFLCSREAVVPSDAALSGQLFQRAAETFLKHTWPQSGNAEEGFAEVLSNPMDLTSVALLLAHGRTPDLFGLEAQQFDNLYREMKQEGLEFRTKAFSAALLKQRLADQENLETLCFGPEVTALVSAKMAIVRTFGDNAGRVIGQETRFRHDRIRDFFTHFAFLDLNLDEMAGHAADARFSGVYGYLARNLTGSQAEDLRERLIRQAAELDDHRVSDSFVREYDWRQRFGGTSPSWLVAYDLPEAKAAGAAFDDKLAQRQILQAEIDADRERLLQARSLTGVLLAADSRDLLDRAGQIYRRCGGSVAFGGQPAPATIVRLLDPTGTPFSVAAVAQAERIGAVHLQLALVQLQAEPHRRVLVTNSAVTVSPNARPPDLDLLLLQMCREEGVWPIEARRLYEAYLTFARTGQITVDWSLLVPTPVTSVP